MSPRGRERKSNGGLRRRRRGWREIREWGRQLKEVRCMGGGAGGWEDGRMGRWVGGRGRRDEGAKIRSRVFLHRRELYHEKMKATF